MSLLGALETLANRGYTDGFYQRHHTAEHQNYMRGHSESTKSQYVGDIVSFDSRQQNGGNQRQEPLRSRRPAGNPAARKATGCSSWSAWKPWQAIPLDTAPGSGWTVRIPLPLARFFAGAGGAFCIWTREQISGIISGHLTYQIALNAAFRLRHQPPHRTARHSRAGGVSCRKSETGAARSGRPPSGQGSGHPLHLQPHRDLLQHRRVREQAIEWMADFHQLKTHAIEPYLYTLPRQDAVKHAFRVASGLDSMVLGETQILGQLKQAVNTAEQAGTLGTLLHKLFQRTFSVAKEVRGTTDIGANSVSMAAAAVRLAQRIFPSIREQNVLFIGAGEMIELCANHFAAQHPKHILVANRTLERANAAGAAFWRRRDHPERTARPSRRLRHHRHLHRQSAADPGQGHGRARHQGAQAPPHVHGRSGRAARHRGRSRRDGRRVPLQRGRSRPSGAGGHG